MRILIILLASLLFVSCKQEIDSEVWTCPIQLLSKNEFYINESIGNVKEKHPKAVEVSEHFESYNKGSVYRISSNIFCGSDTILADVFFFADYNNIVKRISINSTDVPNQCIKLIESELDLANSEAVGENRIIIKDTLNYFCRKYSENRKEINIECGLN